MTDGGRDRWLRHSAAGLGLLALLCLALLTVVQQLSQPRIDAANAAAREAAIDWLLAAASYDNQPLDDAIVVLAPGWIGPRQRVLRARAGTAPVALLLDLRAADGYAGAIDLQLAVRHDGRVLGVRVLSHRETPGLGDAIEAERSDWIERFRGRSLADPTLDRWTLRRDGGDFDQFAGATVTPRAVVAAVRRALQFVERHRDALYTAAAGSTFEATDGSDPAPPR